MVFDIIWNGNTTSSKIENQTAKKFASIENDALSIAPQDHMRIETSIKWSAPVKHKLSYKICKWWLGARISSSYFYIRYVYCCSSYYYIYYVEIKWEIIDKAGKITRELYLFWLKKKYDQNALLYFITTSNKKEFHDFSITSPRF